MFTTGIVKNTLVYKSGVEFSEFQLIIHTLNYINLKIKYEYNLVLVGLQIKKVCYSLAAKLNIKINAYD